MLDGIIVTLIVLAAIVYLVRKFAPAALRRNGTSRRACGACETCGGCDAGRAAVHTTTRTSHPIRY